MDDPYAPIARFYDRAVRGSDDDLDFYRALAGRQGGAVLDLATGTGRVALALAGPGRRVTGVDASAAMLALARTRAAAAALSVRWVEGQMQSFRLRGRFATAICALDSFLHLADAGEQVAALANARRHLDADGVLALDLPSLAAWSDWQPGVRPLELLWSERDAAGVTTSHYATYRMDPSEQSRHVWHIFEETGADGALRRWLSDYRLRFVGRYELEGLLRAAGLRLAHLYGDYDLGPFGAESERMIVLARPAGEE